MDVLISGCGIAGPSLAWWLLRGGHRVTIVEKASAPRNGGYIIDFWGKGYDLAERMGILPQLEAVGYHVDQVALVDDRGRKQGGFGGKVFERLTDGRYISLPRGELAAALYGAVEGKVDARFGETITALRPNRSGVEVDFASGTTQRFDLVVGAEGIHSRVRDLAFGPEAEFERFLGYSFAASVLPDYRTATSDKYVMYGVPGRAVLTFAKRDGSTLALFIWRDAEKRHLPHEGGAARALLRHRFADCGWEVPAMLERLAAADDPYLDRVSQIRLQQWHRGRVALVGDAAFAPSFLAGQGSALAMIGSYVLAGELARAVGDIEAGLSAYHARLAGFMQRKQDAAGKFGSTFVPATSAGLAFRAFVSKFLAIGWIADLAFGSEIRDQVELPDYF